MLTDNQGGGQSDGRLEDDHKILFESIDDGLCVIEVLFDDENQPYDYRFLRANPAFVRQTGLTDAIGKQIRHLAPAHESSWYEIYGKIALTGEPARFEHQADALGRWYEVYAFRVGRPEERQVAVLFRDIKEKKEAAAALRRSEARNRALVSASSDVVYELSRDWEEMRQLDGRGFLADIDAPTVRWLDLFVFPEDQAAIRVAIQQAISERKPFELEHRVRRADGSEGWTLSRAIPVFNDEGEIAEWFGMASDITDRVKAREQQKLLNTELGHRLKNLLALVQSIASQTFKQSASLDEAAASYVSRLSSLGRATDFLTETAWGETSLHRIAEAGLTSVIDFENRVDISGPPIELAAQQALMLTLALHELATNSVKYGALSHDGGSVVLGWSLADDKSGFVLRWRERSSVPVEAPEREGFGTKLITRLLPSAFGGETSLVYERSGLFFEFRAPLVRPVP
ncbi:HWE histidine kinase domain-containing protein [Rhizobium sp. S152]|uniref:sensor histidine kinase n=1 Tax=Rhizobium sp. S152 TaxID=3055038 RepID=UPI0025AA00B8|nr:HWE histidine kinase domain-containing protein [Rhizobium sp. S152]MDM9626549.1 HWE histidine kinase domain-containing protein [Rhizobium sp. S152]